jgi:hypothetical protein
MRSLLLSAALLFACNPVPAPPEHLNHMDQQLLGVTGRNPNPLTFWWWAGNGAELRPALECALTRIRAATCLPVDVSFDAWNWVRQKPPELMPGGRIGSTGGTWDEARISLKAPMGPQTNCRVLVHEIAQHVLQRRNDDGHIGPAFQLSAPLLERICIVQADRGYPCGCFNPEAEDNPIASDEMSCDEE